MSILFEFGKISEIAVSAERIWLEDRLLLTFDVDWANNDVIASTHRLLSEILAGRKMIRLTGGKIPLI
jgi:hypothetical protein